MFQRLEQARCVRPPFLGGYFVPVLLGNTLGGVTLVAALNHAQATSGGG